MRRLVGLLVVLGAFAGAASASATPVLPSGLTQTTAWSNLGNPTVIRFAPDGRVFIASKSGIINVFDNLSDTSPQPYADLRNKVHDFWDRGLLGMALDPQFTSSRPYVYVLYAYDKAPNSTLQPRWGDKCDSPPGATDDGCVISGRLSRLAPDGTETVLIEDWCQQYPSHSTGSIEFGPDGQLYVSSGDGASFNWADYGQDGNPVNPCGDPGAPDRAASQGGALRSQAFRRPAGQKVSLDGSILRVNPDTGAASAGNPAISDANPERRRIIAYGLRNPFRIAFRPGTSEVWSGDVGWNTHEEINRTQNLAQVRNYGWPCYEGGARTSYETLNNGSCKTLYGQGAGAHTAPYYAYGHAEKVVAGEKCPSGSSSISGLTFYTGTTLGAEYRDALFFSDYSRRCIWVALRGTDGLPDMSTRRTFASNADGPVWLTQGPDGALYYADLLGGSIKRIQADNVAPTARISATPTAGVVPLKVDFDGSGSTDPDRQTLAYAWDLDGDNQYDDSTAARPSFTYRSPGVVTVRLRVTDPRGLTGTASQAITIGAPPTLTLDVPTTPWAVGDTVRFSGSARSSAGVTLPASSLTWSLRLRHCSRLDAASCHTHPVQDYAGVASGSFVAPDHEYPSHLELTVTAVDSSGLRTTETVTLMPKTADLTVTSEPAGLLASLGSETLLTPFTRTVLARSLNDVGAAPQQVFEDGEWTFAGWAGSSPDGRVTAPQSGATTITARFTRPPRTSLAGTELVGSHVGTAQPGRGSIFQMTGAVTGTANSLRVWLDQSSRASRMMLGLYSDRTGAPGALLGSGSIERPVAGAWNTAYLPAGVPIVTGRSYWLALHNPPDSAGTLAWADRAAASRAAQHASFSAFPATWLTGSWQPDGHVSGGAWPDTAPDPEPTPPAPTPTPEPTATPTVDPPAPPQLNPAPLPPPSVDVPPAGPRLVGLWIKSLRLKNTRMGFILRGPRTDAAFTLTARVYAQRSGTILKRGSAFRLTTRALTVPRNRWTRVAMTFDGRTLRTYRNGRLVSAKRTARPGTDEWRVGGFTGRVDDIRLYDGLVDVR
ncbi:PQQ-dependent sugar dehydrogenase [Solirubrobacter sp. CPCC 204708]|uniref:PQQ-dependent sugar dehydrogenase n=1 Tax=Solirubrobacter deserti TaxID=2282478 RepID=A0ABT4RQ08_9ACTN|nr:PQQ-dependent sugar dehydrogenase [Solirubrobacter deserti]MBE2320603.1 PQQ-dependent sugar dehydrogenase [Solirubrobacter deserti]MDA0140658.1 PQQ-dependent sugar dehydrogenase [Solirubrobacter deserti]